MPDDPAQLIRLPFLADSNVYALGGLWARQYISQQTMKQVWFGTMNTHMIHMGAMYKT